MTDWWTMALGPLGALVIALSAALWTGRELRRVQAEQVRRLEKLNARRADECAALQAKLDTEHAARLADAQATTRTLLSLNDRIHQTLDTLEALTRPTGTTPRTPP